MGSATVPGQLRGTGPHDWAGLPASGFERWDLLRGLRAGGGNFGTVSHLEFTLYPVSLHPVSAILGELRNQHVRPAR